MNDDFCPSEDVMKDVFRFDVINDLLRCPIVTEDQGEGPLHLIVCVCVWVYHSVRVNCGDVNSKRPSMYSTLPKQTTQSMWFET